jgi:hypothetical protein
METFIQKPQHAKLGPRPLRPYEQIQQLLRPVTVPEVARVEIERVAQAEAKRARKNNMPPQV